MIFLLNKKKRNQSILRLIEKKNPLLCLFGTLGHCTFLKFTLKSSHMKRTSSSLAAVFVMLIFDGSWGSLAWTDWLNEQTTLDLPPPVDIWTTTVQCRPSEKKIVFGLKVLSIDSLGLILWLFVIVNLKKIY